MALGDPTKTFTEEDLQSSQYALGMAGTLLVNNLNYHREDGLAIPNEVQRLHESTFDNMFHGGALLSWETGGGCEITHPGGLVVRVPANSKWLIGNIVEIEEEQNCEVPAGTAGGSIRWLHIGQDGTCVVKTTSEKTTDQKWIIAARIIANETTVTEINQYHEDVDKLGMPESMTTNLTSPTSIDIGDSASIGSETTPALADHQHEFPAPSPGYPTTVEASGDDGVATTPARSDHQHALGIGTTQGDLLVYGTSAWEALEVGEDGEILVADSTATGGIKWAGEASISTFYTFTVSVPASQSSVNVNFPGADFTNPIVICTPNWQTSFWVTDVSSTGFTLHVGTAPAYDQLVYVMVAERDYQV